ncbi:DNA adenine methylase [Streptomyces sp. NBC_00825]|uniref:DNA adenine methylase n=1 Tax=unclassified Streptomyces TaxID=2593676 RepID=UPI002ED5C5D6|nr:DNA adenine methylase [Streptomyces sp. NBC_00826]WTH91580.1 DNA adenine methylase [Streptomyces sp. NBC_00825]WTI00308.1 DNA adenine methylase [Streptomyces sp. NBC_00822]
MISPLRYPGAKRQLVPVIEGLIAANIPPPGLLVEPFCGGATTTLRLLGAGVAQHGILADVDPLVAAFWKTAAFDSVWLTSSMRELTITVEEWDRWRAVNPRSRRDRALKCLFLNRTTFSGILHGRAGPIGGRAQASKYKIDCRFGMEGLTRRINGVAELASTGRLLDVWQADWRTALQRVSERFGFLEDHEVVIYLDPPYVDKAPWLYQWSFGSDEHKALAHVLQRDMQYRWLLSYDDHGAVRELYRGQPGQAMLHVSHRYTAAGSEKRTVKDELLMTNLPSIPPSDHYRLLDPQNSAN